MRGYRHHNHSMLATIAAAFCVASSARVHAGNNEHLFGDWNGERTRLSDKGIDFNLGYDSQVAHNFRGGTRSVTRYTDQWTAGVTFDFDKLWGWHGASFKWLMTQRDGRNTGNDAYIGSNQSVQDLYGRGQTLHLTVFAFEKKWRDGAVEWRIGRLPVGRDVAGFSCNFQNLTFCGSQPGNIVGDYWVNWPTSQWATVLKVKTSDTTYVEAGAYQVNPKYIDNEYARANGWKPDFPSGTTGALIPVEFGWTPKLHGLPGIYKLGAWHSSSPGDDLFSDQAGQPLAVSGGTPLQHASRHGAYIDFKQQVTGEAKGRGLTLFLRAVRADAATSSTDRQISAGVEYQAPFGRSHDAIGFGVGATHSSDRLVQYQKLYNQTHTDQLTVQGRDERAAELFYSWSPVASIKVRPNLQFVHDPGGTARNRDALVLGVYSSVKF
ncbi:MAG: carbohydrate porin [Luteimonas sp.]